MPEHKLDALGKLIHDVSDSISFTILEIGAVPLEGTEEPFYRLLDIFPGSKIIAFEVEGKLCEELNKKSRPEIRYYPVGLGRTEEKRAFYETVHPMCCSLYEPNEELIKLYNNMEVAMIKSVISIDTMSLDNFNKNNHIDDVDFIKIDIQGAELEVFQGGVNTLKDVVAIVSEVEFVPHYIEQPLFGEVCEFLTTQGLMYHKLLGVGGRALKPVIMNQNPNFASQHIWSDAVFIRNILELSELSLNKLLKMGVLAFLYGSPDLAFRCFSIFDEQKQTDLSKKFLRLLNIKDVEKNLNVAAEKSIESSIVTNNESVFKKVGRNELCPCGSRQKFKECHGKLA